MALSDPLPQPPAGCLLSSCRPNSRARPATASIAVEVAERIAHRLDVLGQEVRVRLVYVLCDRGELSVTELAEAVGVSVYDASQHLSVLRGEGIVRRIRDRQFVRYRLDDPTAIAIYEQVTARIREQIDRSYRAFTDDQPNIT